MKTQQDQVPASFSSLLYINECLLDEERTRLFQKAIARQVRPGNLVIDAGTGSGILALFSAEAGARKVYAVECDHEAAIMARRSIRASTYSDRIEVVEDDIRRFTLPEPADVLIMEMLDTGLIAEQQAPALNAMRNHNVIGPETRLLPERVLCVLELAEYDFTFYGFSMPVVVQSRNVGVQQRVRKLLSERFLYREVDFGQPISTCLKISKVLRVKRSGHLNAFRLTSQTVLCAGLSLWETTDMNMPVIVPVGPLEVRQSEEIRVDLKYIMGGGYGGLSASVSRLKKEEPNNRVHATRYPRA